MHGMLVVDKPIGMTSFDVIRKLRRILKTKALGHTGTLDPAASGVLCVCVGWGTRLIPLLEDDHKVYRAELRFGVETNTDDAEGEVISERPVDFSPGDLESAVARFEGPIMQRPPAFSAIKIKGERAYAKARRGEDVTLPERPVRVDEITIESHDGDRAVLRVTCGKGTYIRSLARDIGNALGCGAHLSALRRFESGAATLEQAVPLARLEQGEAPNLISPYDMLPWLPTIRLDAGGVADVRCGRMAKAPNSLRRESRVRIVHSDEPTHLIAIGETIGPLQVRPRRVRPAGA